MPYTVFQPGASGLQEGQETTQKLDPAKSPRLMHLRRDVSDWPKYAPDLMADVGGTVRQRLGIAGTERRPARPESPPASRRTLQPCCGYARDAVSAEREPGRSDLHRLRQAPGRIAARWRLSLAEHEGSGSQQRQSSPDSRRVMLSRPASRPMSGRSVPGMVFVTP